MRVDCVHEWAVRALPFLIVGGWFSFSLEVSAIGVETSTFGACGLYSSLKPLSPELRQFVDKYVLNVSQSVRKSFQLASTRQFERAGGPALKGVKPGELEAIPKDLWPQEKRNLEIAEFINHAFQSETEIVEMTSNFAKKLGEARARFKPNEFQSDRYISIKSDTSSIDLVASIARNEGWGEITVIRDLITPEEFRVQVLKSGALFFDRLHREDAHSQSSHLLQWLFLTPSLDQRFGPGATRQFMQYLGTEEGFPLWKFLFDRPRGYFRDFRGPVSFSEFRLTGPNSWFGLD